MNRIYQILSILATLTLSACSLTGLNSSDKLACNAPDGVSCMSATGVYTNSIADNLPAQRSASSSSDSSAGSSSSFVGVPLLLGIACLSLAHREFGRCQSVDALGLTSVSFR